MATCPNCKGEMNAMAALCPHCGYDFPLLQPEERGFAYSFLANLALVVGKICSALGAVWMLIWIVAALFASDLRASLSGILSFFILLALYVVFQRVIDIQ